MNPPVTPASVPTTDQPPPLKTNPIFRLLLFAQAVSQFGSAVSLVALPLLAVLMLHANPFQVGLVAMSYSLPNLVVMLPAGAWVDRVRRRSVLIAADAVRAGLTAAIVVLAVRHTLSILSLCVLVGIVGALKVFFEAAHSAYLPGVVEKPQLNDANGRLRSRSAVMEFLGQSTAGFLVQALTAPVALLVDAASFAISAVAIAAIRKPEDKPQRVESMGKQIGTAFRIIREDELMPRILAFLTWSNLIIAAQTAIAVPFLVHTVHASSFEVGVVLACDSAGVVLGSRLAPWLSRKFRAGPVITVAAMVEVVVGVLVPLTQPGRGLILFAAGMFLINASVAAVSNQSMTYRQLRTPLDRQGSVGSALRLFVLGAVPLGAVLGGLVATSFGLRWTMWLLWWLTIPGLAVIGWAKAWGLDLKTVTPIEINE
jgi:MFS family permease